MKINKNELSILVIEKESIEKYLDFMNLIKSTTNHKEYLVDYTKEELIHLLDQKSYIYLFQLHNIIVSSIMIIPSKDNDKVMEIGPQAVFQDLRGNKIQQYMIERMEKISKKLGFQKCITKLHSEDKTSIHNFLKRGFQLLEEKQNIKGIKNTYCKDI